MNNSYVSKLISIFLGLSILISSVIFVFSDLFFNKKSQINQKENVVQSNNKTDLSGKNAFVESSTPLLNYYSTISLDDEFKPSGNLTDDFASYVAKEIVKANPNGPQINEFGNKNINISDPEKLASDFILNGINKEIILKTPEEELNKIVSQLKINNFPTKDEISLYLDKLTNLLNSYLELEKVFDFKSSDVSKILVMSEGGYQKTSSLIRELSQMTVPINFKNFHESWLAVLVYQTENFETIRKINIDPLYVVYNLQKNQINYNKKIQSFEKEINNINNITASNINNLNQPSFLKNIFIIPIIPKAYGFFGVIVKDPFAISQRAAQFAKQHWQWIQEQLKKAALEILKDQLIHRLVQQVIRWVQGDGKPQFVTDWKGFFADAVSRGVGKTLYEIYPRICEPFRPLIQIAFQAPVNVYEEYVACTLGDIVRNLENFYNDFKYGGWISYGAILRPENNFYGSLIISRDLALVESAKEKEAEKSDVESSRGFLSTKICVSWTNSDVMKKEVAELYAKKGDRKICGPTKVGGQEIPEGYCIIQVCDQYENRTPGELIASTLDNAISSPIHRIVNAQDITSLVSALVNSGLMKLIQAGQRGLLKLFTKEIGSGNIDQRAISNIDDPCYGMIPGTEEYNDCLSISNDQIYRNIDTTEYQIELVQLARSVLDQLQKARESYNQWLELASNIQTNLEIIGGCNSGSALCPNISDSACDLKNRIESIKPEIEKSILFIQSDINNIQRIIEELDKNRLSVSRIREINDLLGRINNDPSITKAEEFFSNLQILESTVNENIYGSPQCNTSLYNL